MRRFKLFAIVATVASILAFAVPAGAQSSHAGQKKLVCAAEGGATCTLNSRGAKGSAELDTTLGGAASVYYLGYNESTYGVLLSDVPRLSFTYTGTSSTTDPHFSVPIDENNDGVTEAFAFIPAATCDNGSGLVDVINDPTCLVYYAPDGIAGYANWADFAAAHPTYEVSLSDYYIIVIADSTVGGGVWTISNVTVGRPGK